MYSVSNQYIEKLKSTSIKHRIIRGNVDEFAFTEDDILQGSFSYSDIAVKSADIKLGGVFIGSLKLTFLGTFANRISRGTWRGRTINVSLGLEISNGVYEYVPLKPYVIDEANHSALGVDVVAYDYMNKFDASIIMGTTTGSLFGMATLACDNCHVELGMTAEEMRLLPNGDQLFGLYPDNDVETWRDLISWIAVTIGGFATINREGKLIFKNWTQTPVIEIDKDNRFTGGTWSDFQTNYTAITVSNIEDGTQSYYSVTPDNGLTLDIGANPLMQYGVESVKETQRRAVLGAIQSLKYIPFKSSSLIDPCLDLGDVVAYRGGLADVQSLCCVMRIEFSFTKGATLQGYGKNPSLNNARSANDKKIAQNARGQKSQGISYYPFVNAENLELGETETSLYRIEFAIAEETTVEVWHELKILSELDQDVQEISLHYYYDGELIDYEPINTYGEDGYHIFKGDYALLNISAGVAHSFEVTGTIDSGSASIAIGDLHALLKGQKMDASGGSERDISCSDTYIPLLIGQGIWSPISESVSLRTQQSGLTLYLTTENGDSVMAETGIDPIILE